MTWPVHPFDTGRVRYGQPECVHGTPGGDPSCCALCRLLAARHEDTWPDVAMLAAGDR